MASSRPSSPARDAALIAVFAGFVAALGVVPAFQPPGFSVPITAQSLGVMLAGAILGGRRGFAALALFLALVAIGLPLLAGGRGGLGVFATPTADVIHEGNATDISKQLVVTGKAATSWVWANQMPRKVPLSSRSGMIRMVPIEAPSTSTIDR